jgi:hypothetical protein
VQSLLERYVQIVDADQIHDISKSVMSSLSQLELDNVAREATRRVKLIVVLNEPETTLGSQR